MMYPHFTPTTGALLLSRSDLWLTEIHLTRPEHATTTQSERVLKQNQNVLLHTSAERCFWLACLLLADVDVPEEPNRIELLKHMRFQTKEKQHEIDIFLSLTICLLTRENYLIFNNISHPKLYSSTSQHTCSRNPSKPVYPTSQNTCFLRQLSDLPFCKYQL